MLLLLDLDGLFDIQLLFLLFFLHRAHNTMEFFVGVLFPLLRLPSGGLSYILYQSSFRYKIMIDIVHYFISCVITVSVIVNLLMSLLHPSTHPSTQLIPKHLPSHPLIHPPIHPPAHPLIHPPIHPPAYPLIHPPIHPPAHPLIHPPIQRPENTNELDLIIDLWSDLNCFHRCTF